MAGDRGTPTDGMSGGGSSGSRLRGSAPSLVYLQQQGQDDGVSGELPAAKGQRLGLAQGASLTSFGTLNSNEPSSLSRTGSGTVRIDLPLDPEEGT